MNTTATTAQHLRTIALHWGDLRDALGQPAIAGAFGLGLRGYLAALDEADNEPHAQLLVTIRDEAGRTTGYRCVHCGDLDPGHAHPVGEERDPGQLGQRPVPIRLFIADTMRAVEAALHTTADQIADSVQRQPIRPAPAAWPTADRARRNAVARGDALDPRRWRWSGTRRPVPYTALWLLARVEDRPGPFRKLTVREVEQIGVVAAGAADRIERALDIAAQRRTLAQRHECGGEIEMHGGEGKPPVARCGGCGRIWTEGGLLAA
ncbi:hypothetical protein [Streptomyces sp. SGAir0957]